MRVTKTGGVLMKRSIQNLVLASATLLAAVLPGIAMADDDACYAIAKAKYAQWQQPRMMRDALFTMADGSTKTDEVIFTENMLYAEQHGMWRTGPINTRQRMALSPATIEKNLGAASCQRGGHVEENGQSATVYTYNSESDGFETTLTMLVGDSSGLPLKVEMRNAQPRGNQAVMISASYTYNDAVLVPARASMADIERRETWHKMLRNLQLGKSATF